MRISIITVCYNSEKTIERTIKSVFAQSVDDLEYILVDGKSVDGTIRIISQYEQAFIDKGWRYTFISESDNGMYDAMNKGIHMATGELIGILNSDDWYEDDTLSIISEKYKNNPDADILMGAIRILNGNQIIVKKARDRSYKTSRDFNHPAMFVTKECYKEVGDYKIGNVHDDYGWYLKAKKNGKKVQIIDEILTDYPTGGEGSRKSFYDTVTRIGKKYLVYKENEYSFLYFGECFFQEIAKFIILKR